MTTIINVIIHYEECLVVEDKIFDLITKLYSDINIKLDRITQKLDDKADKLDIVRLEDKFGADNKALFDGYKQTYEKLLGIEFRLGNISEKVGKQDIEIKVIKNAAGN